MDNKTLALISALSMLLLAIDYYSYCVRTENHRNIQQLRNRLDAVEWEVYKLKERCNAEPIR